MRARLRKTNDNNWEASWEIHFDTFAAFTATLDRHIGDSTSQPWPRVFWMCYTGFRELMEVLECGDTAHRRAHERGLDDEIQSNPAADPVPPK